MAYTSFAKTEPDASTQSIGEMAQSIRDNQQTIIDGILYGGMEGWDGAVTIGTGTAAKPQYWKFDDGSEYIKITPTWDSPEVRPLSLLIEHSTDDVIYDTIGTITITWSGDYYSSHAWS